MHIYVCARGKKSGVSMPGTIRGRACTNPREGVGAAYWRQKSPFSTEVLSTEVSAVQYSAIH